MSKHLKLGLAFIFAIATLLTSACVRWVPKESIGAASQQAAVIEKPTKQTLDPLPGVKENPAYKTADPKPYAWTTQNQLIAHGMGGIDGNKRVTNCLEAFQRNYDKGFRVFEVDLIETADSHLVARHDWEAYMYDFLGQPTDNPYKVMTVNEFKKAPIHGKYTPLTLDDVVMLMKAYPDAYFMTDTKNTDPEAMRRETQQIVAAIGPDKVLAKRLIIQVYNKGCLDAVRSVYDFKNIVFTMYQLKTDQVEPAMQMAASSGVKVFAYPDTWASQKFTKKVLSHGLTAAVYPVNEPETFKDLRRSGVSLVYTDFLKP